MREETAVENGVEGVEHGETTHEEKRPSVAMLKNMLENSPQNLFHQPYNNGVQKRLHSSSQNGVSGDSTRANPFYSYYLESANKFNVMEDDGSRSSGAANDDSIFPPPDYDGSSLDLGVDSKTVENGGTYSESLNASPTCKHKELFQTNNMDQSVTANDLFCDISLKSPETISRNTASTQNSSKPWHRNGFNSLKDEYFQKTKRENTEGPTEVQSPQPVASNPFYHKAAEADLFQAGSNEHDKPSYDTPDIDRDIFDDPFKKHLDPFSSSSVTSVDPFPSPLSRNLFSTSSLDDPLSPSPSKEQDHFQDVLNGTSDIFQPRSLEAKESMDASETTSFKFMSATPLFNSPSDMKLSTPASTDFKKPPKPLPPYRPKSSSTGTKLVLSTPQGSQQDLLQSTPFSESNSPSASPSLSPADMTHVSNFKRPPKPLPRIRRHKPEILQNPARPPQPESPLLTEISLSPITPIEAEPDKLKPSPKPLLKLPPKPPKPALRLKTKTPESKPVDPENYVIIEDVLLTGQEQCVEDWPEDSPELNPDFKPSGKFKLRRESMKVKLESDGASSEDMDGSGSHSKKKHRTLRRSLLSIRRSKDKFPEDTVDDRSSTPPITEKSMDGSGAFAEENEDDYYGSLHFKKKTQTKSKVNGLFRRASTATSVLEGKPMNGLQESKVEFRERQNSDPKINKRRTIERRHTEKITLDDRFPEEEEGGEYDYKQKKKGKVKVKFGAQKGFAIMKEKPEDELKGAHGYTPHKGYKEKSLEDLGAYGFTPRDKSKDFADDKEMEGLNLEFDTKGALMDDEDLQKPHRYSQSLNGDVDGIQDKKHKKSKTKFRSVGHRSSKENMLEDSSMQKKKSSFSAKELDDEVFYGVEDLKPKNSKQKVPTPRKPRSANKLKEGGSTEDVKNPKNLEEEYDEDNELDLWKPKKQFKLKKNKKFKQKSKALHPEGKGSAGDLSEAAKAEWMAAQKDGGLDGLDEDDYEEDGDTDSLMEWWYTVEQWDELPSDEEDAAIKEDESKSFNILAYKVQRGLRVFNKVFMEQAEALWEDLIRLHALADDISEFHQKAKIAGITGGTTTAVGSVAAITGLALAPITFGASLVITAVGVGVATAGGIATASAAISDNVNNMNDRKKIETLLHEYEERLLDIAKILHFVNHGLVKLRGHPFLRSGTQHYAQDWEVRNAVQIISLVDSPVMKATEITDNAVVSLQSLFKGIDKYFTKETRELKKGYKSEIVNEIRHVANVLNDCIVDLNEIREDLQTASGL